MAQTSDKVSSLAGFYASYTIKKLADDAELDPVQLVHDIRSMAASLLRQDETKGARRFLAKVFGK